MSQRAGCACFTVCMPVPSVLRALLPTAHTPAPAQDAQQLRGPGAPRARERPLQGKPQCQPLRRADVLHGGHNGARLHARYSAGCRRPATAAAAPANIMLSRPSCTTCWRRWQAAHVGSSGIPRPPAPAQLLQLRQRPAPPAPAAAGGTCCNDPCGTHPAAPERAHPSALLNLPPSAPHPAQLQPRAVPGLPCVRPAASLQPSHHASAKAPWLLPPRLPGLPPCRRARHLPRCRRHCCSANPCRCRWPCGGRLAPLLRGTDGHSAPAQGACLPARRSAGLAPRRLRVLTADAQPTPPWPWGPGAQHAQTQTHHRQTGTHHHANDTAMQVQVQCSLGPSAGTGTGVSARACSLSLHPGHPSPPLPSPLLARQVVTSPGC